MTLKRYKLLIVNFLLIVFIGINNNPIVVTSSLWEDSRVAGVVDLNNINDDFNILSVTSDINDEDFFNKSKNQQNDLNPSFDNNVFFNYWGYDGLDLLLLNNIQSYFQQDFFGIKGFTINGSNPVSLFLQQFPVNSDLNALILYSFLGFLLEENNQSYFGYSLTPSNIRDFFSSNISYSFPEFEFNLSVSKDKVEIVYNNLLLFWSSIPPNTTISISGFSTPISTPILLHPSIEYITLFKDLKLSFNLVKRLINPETKTFQFEIQQHFQLGKIDYLGINESLPTGNDWFSSFEIQIGSPLTINIPNPFPNLEYTLTTPFSIYTQANVQTRLSQMTEDLTISTLIGLNNYLYKKENFTGQYIPSSIFSTQNQKLVDKNTLKQFQQSLTWNYNQTENKKNINDKVTPFYSLEALPLFQTGDNLYPVRNELLFWETMSQDTLDYYNSLLRPYNRFLSNFSNSFNIQLTFPIRFESFDLLVKSSFSPLTGKESPTIGYFPYLVMISPKEEINIGSLENSVGFSAIILSIAIIGVIIFRQKKSKKHK
ncbi:MAG: hypothetical protein ACXAC7_08125 [Candidatus Hodarchaeales archaeon]